MSEIHQLIASIVLTCVSSTWYIARTIRSVETGLGDKLELHMKEDRRIFQEHGLRLQKVELKQFGFTGAGEDAFP